MLDCAIIGGGPAGLTAALYLGRFLRRVVVIEDGESRAGSIPVSHTIAGFPEGITGPALLARMRAQAAAAGAGWLPARVERVERGAEGFGLTLAGGGSVAARRVILATGVRNHAPALPRALHDRAVAAGLLRYCPICDGHEARGLRIGVLGDGAHAMAEAAFIRTFSGDVTLIPPGAALRPGWPGARVIAARAAGERWAVFDTVYVALGTAARSGLLAGLGVRLTGDGCVVTDGAQETGVPGFFAAGDVTDALDQVAVAVGQGAVAATGVHNGLRRDGQGR